MHEIVRTNDAVLITAIEALLNGANIRHVVLDRNMCVLEGSIGMLPRRIMVEDDQVSRARRLLTDAGLGAAGLALAQRVAGLIVTLVEIDSDLTALAEKNVARNDLVDRVRVVT